MTLYSLATLNLFGRQYVLEETVKQNSVQLYDPYTGESYIKQTTVYIIRAFDINNTNSPANGDMYV
jgi:hypothetical protein